MRKTCCTLQTLRQGCHSLAPARLGRPDRRVGWCQTPFDSHLGVSSVSVAGHVERDVRHICGACGLGCGRRSEEHTSELQSLMRISYAVFCLKTKKRVATLRCHSMMII